MTYRTHRVSRDLQIWIVEGRDYRSPNRSPDGPDKSLWGDVQRQWLKRTLIESDATSKSSPRRRRSSVRMTAIRRTTTPIRGGFRHEGEMFLNWARDAGLLNQLLIICGDRHWQYHSVHPTGIEEFACGPLNDENARVGRKPGDPRSTDPNGLIDQPYTYEEPSGGFLEVEVTTSGAESDAHLVIRFFDDEGERKYEVGRSAPCLQEGDNEIDEHVENDHHSRHAEYDLYRHDGDLSPIIPIDAIPHRFVDD